MSTTSETAKSANAPEARPGSKDQLILPHLDLVGSVPDREVAKKAGVSAATIRNFRELHRISPYRRRGTKRKKASRRSRTGKKGKPGRKSKIEPFHALVGKISDEDLAAKAGAAVSTVKNYRRRHGIPAPAGKAPETAARKAASAPGPRKPSVRRSAARDGGGSWGWRITFAADKERIVVARNAAEAVAQAGKAGLGDILNVQRLIEALA